MFSDSESENESVHQITVNEHFAKAYAHKKEREELQKLKEKYGSDAEEDDADSEDSEEDETEDEDGEELTPAMDAAILRTLARIKKKDPSIYEKDKDVFEEEQKKTKQQRFTFSTEQKKDKSKPLRMHQHVLESTLKETSRSPSPEPAAATYVQEQETLRNETIHAFKNAVSDDSSDSDGDELLVPRERTKDEIEKQKEEYKEFLAKEVGEDIKELVTVEESVIVKDEEKIVEVKHAEKAKSKRLKGKERQTETDQEFLMNYILNRGWIDHSKRHVPTYREVTGSSSKHHKQSESGDDEDDRMDVDAAKNEEKDGNDLNELDEDEFDEIADTFESSYNFRFEEPDAATISTHPRQIDSIARRNDSARKEARERKKARKEEKVLKKREEIKRLKALKMKEIREKLERIGKEGGKTLDEEALQVLDLEGDWDPEKHDEQMEGLYGADEGGDEGGQFVAGDDGEEDFEKPTWDDDIDITDIVGPGMDGPSTSSSSKKDKKKKKKKKGEEEAEDGVDVDAMDADALHPAGNNYNDEEEWDGTEEMRKRKLDEYMDELYEMEFNDMVGDLPTRFKYVPVLPQTYDLSATEILLADDGDLNSYVGLRKFAPYRKDKGQSVYWDPKRRDRLKDLKDKIRERKQKSGLVGVGDRREGTQRGDGEIGEKKRKGKKERMKAKLAAAVGDAEGRADKMEGVDNMKPSSAGFAGDDVADDDVQQTSKKRKRKHKRADASSV